eukprot:gb/GECG01005551.1/.p1 GENE.gb/GECG01005551.1/~~gb/GECG01005551.1/.p1  ORF type:complete len:1042 (+),score=127.26 gb/GECG01005551.1/:1-3126(+)
MEQGSANNHDDDEGFSPSYSSHHCSNGEGTQPDEQRHGDPGRSLSGDQVVEGSLSKDRRRTETFRTSDNCDTVSGSSGVKSSTEQVDHSIDSAAVATDSPVSGNGRIPGYERDIVAQRHGEDAAGGLATAAEGGGDAARAVEGNGDVHRQPTSSDGRMTPSLTSTSFSDTSISDDEDEVTHGEYSKILYIARKLFRWYCRNCCEANEFTLTKEALSYAKAVVEYFQYERERRQREAQMGAVQEFQDSSQAEPASTPARPNLPEFPDLRHSDDRCSRCHLPRSTDSPGDYKALLSFTLGTEVSEEVLNTVKEHIDCNNIPHIPAVTAVPFIDTESRTYINFPSDKAKQMDSMQGQFCLSASASTEQENETLPNGRRTEYPGGGKGLSSLSKINHSESSDSEGEGELLEKDEEDSLRANMLQALERQWTNNCVSPATQSLLGGFGAFTPICALAYSSEMCSHFAPEDYEERFCPDIKFPSTPHPERPDRIRAIAAHLAAQGLFQRCWRVPVRKAKRKELLLTHSELLYETIKQSSQGKDFNQIQLDTYVNDGTFKASRLSCGGVLSVMERILCRQASCGLAIVRPPGHHAECSHSMGFCIFNNVAVAAAVAKAKWGLKRILILDWDVHHGNGTQNMFYRDPEVLYLSLHRFDGGSFFPGTGAASEVGGGPGEGYTVNIPWPCRGMGDAEYISAFDQVVLPIARQYAPELVIVSAGFDAAKGDPLGGCNVTPAGYAHMTSMLKSLAGGRVLVALEGGYNLRSISKSVEAVTKVLLGDAPPPLETHRGSRHSVSSPSALPAGIISPTKHLSPEPENDETLRHSQEPAPDNVGLSAPESEAVWTIARVVRTHSTYWSSLRVYHKAHLKQALRRLHQGVKHGTGKGAFSSSLLRKHPPGQRRRSHDWTALPWPSDMPHPSPKRPREAEDSFFDSVNSRSPYYGDLPPAGDHFPTSHSSEPQAYVATSTEGMDEHAADVPMIQSITMSLAETHDNADTATEERLSVSEFPATIRDSNPHRISDGLPLESLGHHGEHLDDEHPLNPEMQ